MQTGDSLPGVITTFYSYKGGTGRSMLLANIACLAARALADTDRVLMIDWDLEAPGLHRYFPKSERGDNAERLGLIDYFSCLNSMLDDDTYARLYVANAGRALESILPINEYIAREVAERVDLIKAGRFSEDHSNLIGSFNWADFYRRRDRVYRAFCEYIASKYRWCFIDSRTGFSDVSGVCTMIMPEKLVTVFTLNNQSLEGVLDIIGRAVEYRRKSDDPRPLTVFPLPSRIIAEEQLLLEAAQKRYRRLFEECLKDAYQLEECDLDSYFKEVAIPHKGFYGFQERVAVRDDSSATDALSINRAYERFLQRLITLHCAWEPISETESSLLAQKRTDAADQALSKSRLRRVTTLSLSVVLMLLVIAIATAWYARRQVTIATTAATTAQSQFLALKSTQATAKGDSTKGIQLALEALPPNGPIPYLPEAVAPYTRRSLRLKNQ
jgi:MinD-like ATPase involved in chromosome partitioning or flagellar assembly